MKLISLCSGIQMSNLRILCQTYFYHKIINVKLAEYKYFKKVYFFLTVWSQTLANSSNFIIPCLNTSRSQLLDIQHLLSVLIYDYFLFHVFSYSITS